MTDKPAAEEDRGPVWSFCGQITHLTTGEGAALRRMALTQSFQADGIVEKLLLKARVLRREDDADFESWKLLAHAAAIVAGTGGRFPYSKRPLGRALAAVGLKEAPVLRLLSARGAALPDQIRRVARILARGAPDEARCDLGSLRELADPDETIAEAARRRIARDYYAAADKPENDNKGGNQ